MHLTDARLFRQQCYVGGTWIDADNGETSPVANPATGEALGNVPQLGAAEVKQAIAVAEKAFHSWRARTAKERSTLLRRWFNLMLDHQEDLAVLMTLEQGKPLAESRGEIAYAASFIEWFAEEAKRVYGDVIPPHQADKRIVVLKEPIGVCAAITPWNEAKRMTKRSEATPRFAPMAASSVASPQPMPSWPRIAR